MQDIADELGVSKNSVSQALRDKPGVSLQTKILVKSKADELGYHYMKNDKKEMQQKFLLIATEFVFSQTSFFGEIVKNIEIEANKLGFSIHSYALKDTDLLEEVLPPNIEKYDGVIIVSHSRNDYIKKVIATGLPIVLVDHHEPNLYADAILSKNTDGAFHAISLLAQNNIKRIGFIGDISFSPSYLERYRGYHRALREYDLSIDTAIEITTIEESQGALFSSLKKIKEMPEAWFCVNSGLAFMLNNYLQSSGYTIPDDVSIICFDETEFTKMSVPQITNVSTDLVCMGQMAVRSLIYRMENRDLPFIHQQIVPQLNIRESVKLIDKM